VVGIEIGWLLSLRASADHNFFYVECHTVQGSPGRTSRSGFAHLYTAAQGFTTGKATKHCRVLHVVVRLEGHGDVFVLSWS
jgi:hypothetical protein